MICIAGGGYLWLVATFQKVAMALALGAFIIMTPILIFWLIKNKLDEEDEMKKRIDRINEMWDKKDE